MNYELANALKDAGFIQSGKGTRVAPPDKIVARRDDFAYVPTLEELIEACGDLLQHIVHYRTQAPTEKWGAWPYPPADPDEIATGYYGASPTEAVARLWLALNSKRYAGHEAHQGED